jgi:pyruvate dehydrogenase E2 component (dihydrolipoamide acetyltransferase)
MAVTKVVMPKLSEAMETGKVIKWLKKEGDHVQGGDILAEVETDKADVEMEAFGGGVLRKILVQAGDRTPVGNLIAVIAEPNEDISGVLASAPAPAAAPAVESGQPAPAGATSARPAPVPPQPRREDFAARPRVTAAAAAGAGAGESSVARNDTRTEPFPAPAPAGSGRGAAGERVKASPLARKIAAQSGVDLRLMHGSGPGGRIIRRDVEAASVAPAAAPTTAAQPGVEYEDMALTPMRAIIAKRMPLSKAPVPHFYVTSEVAMDQAWELREQLNGLEGQPKISVNDFIVRACALALMEHPGVNASLQGDAIRVFHRAHIGIAVALDEGLITPVLRDCHAKSLAQIATEARDLGQRARTRKLRASELSGATFSISNLGMFDVTEFSAIINPPEGAILAVGSVRIVPVVAETGIGGRASRSAFDARGESVHDRVGPGRESVIRIGRRMALTLSCDHRVMDGAMGARFLQSVKRLLEEPLRLLI